MLSAILLCALAQIQSTVSLEPAPACPTCDALMVRVAALESRLAAQAEPVRRVRLIEAPVVTYAAPPVYYAPRVVTYAAPPVIVRRGLFAPRFAAFSACGPAGCP